MAAYVVAVVQNVTDPAGFTDYQHQAEPTLQKYGGKALMFSNKIEVADGRWSPLVMNLIEFESLGRAKEWYNSPEYSAAKPKRLQATDSALIFADGQDS